MKNIVVVFLLVICVGMLYYYICNEKVIAPTEYVVGIPDTLILHDTVTIKSIKIKTIFDTTTIIVDSTNKILYDSIRTLWQRFDLRADTNIACIGKVRLNRSMFEFDSVGIYYPKILIKQIDTTKITKEIIQPFYEDYWFWTAIIITVKTIISHF